MKWLFPLSYSQGELKLSIRGAVYVYDGVEDFAYREFEKLRRYNQGRALAFLNRFVPEARRTLIEQEESVMDDATIDSVSIPRDQAKNLFPFVGSEVKVLSDGAIVAAVKATESDVEDRCQEIVDLSMKRSLLRLEDSIEVLYYGSPTPEVLDAVGLRARDLGILDPALNIIEHARLAAAFGIGEAKVKAVVERLRKAVQSERPEKQVTEGEKESPVVWLAKFGSKEALDKFLVWVRVEQERGDSDYPASWTILHEDKLSLVGHCVVDKLVWCNEAVTDREGGFSLLSLFDLEPDEDESDVEKLPDEGEKEGEGEEGLEPGMVRCEMEERDDELFVTFVDGTEFSFETIEEWIDFGVACGVFVEEDAEDLLQDPDTVYSTLLDEVDQCPEDYFSTARGEEEPELEPELEEPVEMESLKEQEGEDPWKQPFLAKKMKPRMAARMKGKRKRREKYPLPAPRVGSEGDIRKMDPQKQQKLIGELVDSLNDISGAVAELRDELATHRTAEQSVKELLKSIMDALGITELHVQDYVVELEQGWGEVTPNPRYAEGLRRLYEISPEIFDQVLDFVSLVSADPYRRQHMRLKWKKSEETPEEPSPEEESAQQAPASLWEAFLQDGKDTLTEQDEFYWDLTDMLAFFEEVNAEFEEIDKLFAEEPKKRLAASVR